MPQFAHLPVIAVTARAMPSDREKSLAAGASDYVTKPVDIEELLNRMEQWLSQAPESPPADLAPSLHGPVLQHLPNL
jgi:CheY-like chemotaxis protein